MERGISNVFASEVPIKRFKSDHLYQLLDTQSTRPIQYVKKNPECISTCTKTSGKIYTSRKICKRKVRTVRQIRMEYEQYVLNFLPNDLEMQHKYLLDKICRGSSKEDQIIEKAQKLFRSRSAMRRSSWQMLMNINPNSVAHSMQYVLWKGSTIKLSGSKGGTKKILYNLDLSTKSRVKKLHYNKKNELLRTSLKVTFKPGPLTKKQTLDTSFQKYTLGKTEHKPLPQAGLEIATTCGVPLPPYLLGFLQNCREKEGILTKEWIDFAISSLQNKNDEKVVTFNLPYQNNQKRILLRDNNTHEIEDFESQKSHVTNIVESEVSKKIDNEIKSLLHDLVMAVEVNGFQDTLFLDDDLSIDTVEEEKSTFQIRGKSEKNSELKKLDVTIIHVDGHSPIVDEIACPKQFCVLGCVCQSLQCKMQLKNHCGRFECMFDCKCDFKKYCVNNNYFNGCISGLINLDKKITGNLAKEEQKFHQTVVFTEGKSIVLPSKPRNPRMTKKYSEYLTSLSGKPQELDKELIINLPRLQCANIEAWCMVHELYRCFCAGKYLTNLNGSLSCTNEELQHSTISEETPVLEDTTKLSSMSPQEYGDLEDTTTLSSMAPQEYGDEIIDVVSEDIPSMITSKINSKYEESSDIIHNHRIQHDYRQPEECISSVTCARTNPFSSNRMRAVNARKDTVVTNNEQNLGKIISLNTTNESTHNDENVRKTIPLESTTCNDENVRKTVSCTINESTLNADNVRKTVSPNTINESAFNADNVKNTVSLKTTNESTHNDKNVKTNISVNTINETTHNEDNFRKTISLNRTNESPVRTKKIVFGLWLERHYKHLKERMASGLPIILLKPTPRRISLFPWLELLKRYQLKSNYFLVNKTVPHRVFISVNPTHREFKNCMNLSDVTFDDLPNYPEFVKHFVMNTDLKDNFALLRGSSNYWEVLGIVAKNSNLSIEPLETPIGTEITSPQCTITETAMLGIDTMSESMKSAENDLISEAGEMALTSLSSPLKKVSTKCSDFKEPITERPDKPVIIKKFSTRQAAIRAQQNKERSSKYSSSLKLVSNAGVKRSVSKTDLKTRSSNKQNKKHKSPLFRKRKQIYSNRYQGKPELTHSKVVKERTVSASKRKQTFCISDPGDSISEEISIELRTDDHKKEDHSKSRWFVMAIENDFLHLKFYKKKLFVKLTTITSAIDLARASGQTVILPLSKVNTEDISDIQFGIYATPVKDKACVLIGPYEKNEDLGIETVKNPNCTLSNKKTRGVWLVTKKIDNSNVLENPLSYLSQCSDNSIEVIKGNTDCVLESGKQGDNVKESIVTNAMVENDLLSSSESTKRMAHTILKQEDNLSNIKQADIVPKVNAKITKYSSKNGKILYNASVEDIFEKEKGVYTILNEKENNLNTNETDVTKNTDVQGQQFTYSGDDSSDIQGGITEYSNNYIGEPICEDNSQNPANVENVKYQNCSKGEEINTTNYVNHGGVVLKTNVVKPAKAVKPICIKRNNSFYNFSSNLLKPFSLLKPYDGNAATVVQPSTSGLIMQPPGLQCLPVITNVGSLAPLSSLKLTSILKTLEDSETRENKNNITPASPAKLFTILKPDQINNKALQYQSNEGIEENEEEHLIEDELTDSKSSNSSEVYVVSDDELSDAQPITTNMEAEVLIECSNVRKLGCLWGKRNSEGKISFQFPGFKYSAYYTEDEASNKINQVLSRKAFVPKSLKLRWRAVQPSTGAHTMMSLSNHGHNLIVTKEGFKNTLLIDTSAPYNDINDSEDSDVGSVT